jgi:phage shock protein A
MTDDLFAKLRKFIYQGGNAREALNRAEEEVAYWKDLAANYLHRIKNLELENTGLYGKLAEKDRALEYKEGELLDLRLEIADLRNKVAA